MATLGLLLLTARGGGVPDVSRFEGLQLEHFLLTVLGLQQENTLLKSQKRVGEISKLLVMYMLQLLTLTSLLVSTSILS